MKRLSLIFNLLLLIVIKSFVGCAHYEENPIDAEQSMINFEARSLSDAGLIEFIEKKTIIKTENGILPSWNLELLTCVAFYYHPELEEARARLALAEAGEILAGQRPNPILTAIPFYNSSTGVPTPWIVTSFLNIPLETAGKRSKRLARAGHLSEAEQLNLATVTWDIRARLRQALLGLWSAEQFESLVEAQYKMQSDLVRIMEARLDAGDVADNVVIRSRIALEKSRLAYLDAGNRTTTARAKLASALGVPVSALNGVEFAFDEFAGPLRELPVEQARRHALMNRTDILASLAEYAAAESALQLEIAKQYPNIDLQPNYKYDQGDNEWGLGAFFELPLFHQNQGSIAIAEANRTAQAAKFTALQARVVGEIEAALADYNMARAKLDTTAKTLELLDKQIHQLQAMFKAGELTRLAVVNAQVEKIDAELMLLEVKSKAQEALGQLEKTLQFPSKFVTPKQMSSISRRYQ